MVLDADSASSALPPGIPQTPKSDRFCIRIRPCGASTTMRAPGDGQELVAHGGPEAPDGALGAAVHPCSLSGSGHRWDVYHS